MQIMSYIKEHPYTIAAVVVGGGVVFLMLTRSSGSSVDNSAQVNTAAQLEALRIGATTDAAKIQAQAVVTANRDKVSGVVAVAGIQKAIYDSVIKGQADSQKRADDLAQMALSIQRDNSAKVLEIVGKTGVNHGGSKQEGIINALALAMGQGNIASYNAGHAYSDAAAAQSEASMWASITQSLSGLAKSLAVGA